MLYTPDCRKSGVQSNEPEPLPLSTNSTPAGRVDVVRDGMLSASKEEILKLTAIPSVVT